MPCIIECGERDSGSRLSPVSVPSDDEKKVSPSSLPYEDGVATDSGSALDRDGCCGDNRQIDTEQHKE